MSDARSEQPGVTSARGVVTAALMLAMAVAALEQTVVSPAMPTIIASLRGVEIYPWVFSAYLLAATVTVPIYGKMADLWGRKKVLLFGLALFTLGSICSGFATSMLGLIAMRVVQGLGAGAVAPIVITLIGDLFTLEERAKIQGLFSGVWGLSSLAGPALGGWLTDTLSWRWVFFVTVPFAVLAAAILAFGVRESVAAWERKPIDWGGSLTLAAGSSLLLCAVLGGESRSATTVLWLVAISVALLIAFVRIERRAVDPIVPPDLMESPSFLAAVAGNFLVGGILFGIDTFVPLFVQGARGGTATQAGQSITPLFVAWSISVAVAARVVVRLGFRRTAVAGTVLISSGMLALAVGSLRPDWTGPLFLVGMIIMGLGMGPAALSYILSVQNSVPWERRGVATGAVTFFRTMGGAMSVGALGGILGIALKTRLVGLSGAEVAAAMRPDHHQTLPLEQLAAVRSALTVGIREVFVIMFAMAIAGIACAWPLPARRRELVDQEASDGALSLAIVAE